jgi:transcriptional regulator with XRE-family HTH domain
MKLSDYFAQKNLKTAAFAKSLSITPQALGLYLKGHRIPRFEILWRIEKVTKGVVTANDFHQHHRCIAARANHSLPKPVTKKNLPKKVPLKLTRPASARQTQSEQESERQRARGQPPWLTFDGENKLYGRDEVAKWLGVKPVTIDRLTRQGKLNYVNVGAGAEKQRRRYTERSLLDFIAQQTQQTELPPGRLTFAEQRRRMPPVLNRPVRSIRDLLEARARGEVPESSAGLPAGIDRRSRQYKAAHPRVISDEEHARRSAAAKKQQKRLRREQAVK